MGWVPEEVKGSLFHSVCSGEHMFEKHHGFYHVLPGCCMFYKKMHVKHRCEQVDGSSSMKIHVSKVFSPICHCAPTGVTCMIYIGSDVMMHVVWVAGGCTWREFLSTNKDPKR